MISFDTNLLVYAANADAPECEPSRSWLDTLKRREDVLICELMLVEVYLKLRNSRILTLPYSAKKAHDFCQAFRRHPRWMLAESAPVMADVWRVASRSDFAVRRIIDARLALTVRHYGVTEFATCNVKDFEGFGFQRIWNPLK